MNWYNNRLVKLRKKKAINYLSIQVAKNAGTVTQAHFGRILNFLGIILAAEEFRLLVKRFAKDSYTVNYVAFVQAIEDVQNYMDEHGMLGLSGVNKIKLLI